MDKYVGSDDFSAEYVQQPRVVAVGSLGGTISTVEHETDMLLAEDLLAKCLYPSDGLIVHAKTIALLESSEISFQLLIDFLRWAELEVDNGADGIVLLQGTDTLEESAFFLDLLWNRQEPLVIAGAMRCASDIGTDGYKNLRDALFLAANPEAECRGVLVVLNEEIHEGRWVCKRQSTGVAAFQSANGGVCGSIRGPYVKFWRGAPERLILPVPQKLKKRVGILHASMDSSADLIGSMLFYRYDGLVISGFGTGHVPSSWYPAIKATAAEIPVVISSRVAESFSYPDDVWLPVLKSTQGAVLFSGLLDAVKARILLLLLIETDLLSQESVREKLRTMFMFV